MSKFWSPAVETLAPYVPGEYPQGRYFVKLNTNESPYGPSPRVQDAIRAAVNDDLRLYPDPSATDLRLAIATTHRVGANQVFVGNGSDEVLAHAFKAFFPGKAPIIFPDITYSFYRSYCGLYAIDYRLVPLDVDFRCVPEHYAGGCGGVVIANPNAPTGIGISLADVERILRQNPDVVVIIDEAYVDFGTDSAVPLVAHYENLLVVQTFSKSRSLAGLRVGMAMGQRHLIEALERVKNSFNSYPIGRLALVAALAAWTDDAWFDSRRKRIMARRDDMASRLRTQGYTVLPSATNFMLASHEAFAGGTLLAELRARGILVRHFPHDRTRDWVRISIGTGEECEALLAAMQDLAANRSATTAGA